ncbi:eukaryotic translation initiation factor 3 subunit 8 N-terminus-domain-containing protein [Gorgonomyces haynaldii]|nr:eukaryotic translation initiation factor 3 subunit 8 N-terminus-domain-containing protein [Gorgonomyces haynaldii]
MSNRFFYSLDTSDSDDYLSSEEEYSSSEESKESEIEQKGNFNEFLKGGSDSDSDSEDGVKVVQSAKEKRYQELRSAVKTIEEALDFDDWATISNDYDKLLRLVQKASHLIQEDGVPRFFVRLLVQLEDELASVVADKESVKKMNATASRGLNAMKQKLKKTKVYEREMVKFRANPVTAEESADEQEQVVEEVKPQKVQPQKQERVSGLQLFQRLDEILSARGKKGTDKGQQIDALKEILGQASSPYQKIKCLMSLIPARFDFVPAASGCMSTEMWKNTLEEIKQLHDILDAHPNIKVADEVEDDSESAHEKDQRVQNGETVVLHGVLTSFVDRLDDEFFKSLQTIDPHTTEYIDRLRDEAPLYALMVRAQKYAEDIGTVQDGLDLIIMRRVEHLYFKPDAVVQKFEEMTRKSYPNLKIPVNSAENLVSKLCIGLYKTKIDRIRTRALLCHVFHLALHDNYQQARDMILMSHLQETISQTDVQTQILFNRTMVQIGLSAFRCGLFREAHFCLQDIYSCGKTKELLAQGVSQVKGEKTAEQEKQEKQRQLPFHMHINLELLESVYLTSALLLEVPNMALYSHDSRRKVISKSFRRYLDYNERQVFTGPPENIRDHIMAAAKAMQHGDWEQCKNYVHEIKVWELLSNISSVKQMLTAKIQEETLRTYILLNYSFYETFSITKLSEMFSLTKETVVSIVSKMLVHEEVKGSIKQDLVEIHPTETMTRLQYLAGAYTDKIVQTLEYNEKFLEAKASLLGLSETVAVPQVKPKQKKRI